jgi:cation:H+ antiporter
VLLLIFAAAAAAIWVAGVQLSNQTDVLSTRLGLGSALGGLILLALATNLPETAIVASAALSGNVGVAVGNILGGIAIQTVVLVLLDAAGVRGRHPLTYRAASLVLVLEGLAVIAVLAAVVGGTQLPRRRHRLARHAGGAAHRGALGREPPARPARGSRPAVARVR